MIDTKAKLDSARREVRFRTRVYPGLVARGRMKQAEADHEIAVMKAIAADYETKAAGDAGPLFGDASASALAACHRVVEAGDPASPNWLALQFEECPECLPDGKPGERVTLCAYHAAKKAVGTARYGGKIMPGDI